MMDKVQLSKVPRCFENHRKSLIQQCERSELRLHLSGKKFILKMPKMLKACGQTVLPDMSILM